MSGFLTAAEAAEIHAVLGIRLSTEAPSASAVDAGRVAPESSPSATRARTLWKPAP